MDWLSVSHAVIDCYRRAVVFQVPDQSKFEFLCDSRILKLVVVRARPIGRTLITLDTKEGQIEFMLYLIFRMFFLRSMTYLQKGAWSYLLI